MRIATVKWAGSGHILDSHEVHSIPWLEYRRLKLDPERVKRLVVGIKTSIAEGWKLVIVPGGTAAHLHLSLGEALGVSVEGLHRIGRSAVDLNGALLIEALLAHGVKVKTAPIDALGSTVIRDELQRHEAVVMRASKAYESTDALAAASAAAAGADMLIIFKTGVPLYHVGFESPTIVTEFSLRDLRRICESFSAAPGRNPILDGQSIAIIETHGISTMLVNPDQAGNLIEYLDRACHDSATVIRTWSENVIER